MYDPVKYWENRGKDYTASNPTWAKESLQLKSFISRVRPRKMLEVGSGYGRISEMLNNPVNLDLCDISRSMAYECIKRTGKHPVMWDGVKLPYENDSYDLIISFSVMLHVEPKEIKKHILEMVRVGREVYIATYSGIQSGSHYFAHQYISIFRELGLWYDVIETFGENRIHYVVRK